MKTALIFASLFSVLSFTRIAYEPKFQTAEVNQHEGLYIFTDCKPVMEYETLGFVMTSIPIMDNYETQRDAFIKKAKGKYKTLEGLILHTNPTNVHVEVIRFKD